MHLQFTNDKIIKSSNTKLAEKIQFFITIGEILFLEINDSNKSFQSLIRTDLICYVSTTNVGIYFGIKCLIRNYPKLVGLHMSGHQVSKNTLGTTCWVDFKQNWNYFQRDLHRMKDYASGVQNIHILFEILVERP